MHYVGTIEFDCLRAMKAINSNTTDRSAFGAYTKKSRSCWDSHLDIRDRKLDRESNDVAHVLAQEGKHESSGILHGSVMHAAYDHK
jgi:hypothetical protein